jgi:hypothetical protein
MMRQKIAAKLAAWHGPPLKGRIHVLDEPWGRFTFRDPDQRAQLAAAIDELELDLLVAGPLGRIGMEGAGTSDEIRDFLTNVDEALRACQQRPALFVVHHENKAGTVSGAWEREPDTLVHVQGQGHTTPPGTRSRSATKQSCTATPTAPAVLGHGGPR